MDYNSKLNIKSWAEEDRPREKYLLKGKGSLSDAELVAIIIGSGNKEESAVEVSKKILSSVNQNLNELGRLSLSELINFKGIGEAKAISIAAALELGRRRKDSATEKKITVDKSYNAFQAIKEELLDLAHEEFWILLLNNANQVIGKKNISKGGVTSTVADAKIIFKAAIEKLATSIILCHNHPSGNLKPSQPDISLTKKLVEAGKVIDIKILDHLIVGHGSYFSFLDEGLI